MLKVRINSLYDVFVMSYSQLIKEFKIEQLLKTIEELSVFCSIPNSIILLQYSGNDKLFISVCISKILNILTIKRISCFLSICTLYIFRPFHSDFILYIKYKVC